MILMKSLAGVPIERLKRVVTIREQIEALSEELNELLQAEAMAAEECCHSENRRELSRSGREKIAAAQRLRWSKYKSAQPSQTKSSKPRLSPAGRARVAAAVKARWEKFRAAKTGSKKRK